jgi:hypothetical protein
MSDLPPETPIVTIRNFFHRCDGAHGQVVARGATNDVSRGGGDPLDMRVTVQRGAVCPLPPSRSRLAELSVPRITLHAGG